MSSLTHNIHVIYDTTRAEREAQKSRHLAQPLTLARAFLCLFSASGRDRLNAETGGDQSDKSDAAFTAGM